MSGSAAREIGIVDYPGAQAACILGLTDLFGIASTIALDQGDLTKSRFALRTGSQSIASTRIFHASMTARRAAADSRGL
jgi:hypothetical protein